jgi:hypothetical protein
MARAPISAAGWLAGWALFLLRKHETNCRLLPAAYYGLRSVAPVRRGNPFHCHAPAGFAGFECTLAHLQSRAHDETGATLLHLPSRRRREGMYSGCRTTTPALRPGRRNAARSSTGHVSDPPVPLPAPALLSRVPAVPDSAPKNQPLHFQFCPEGEYVASVAEVHTVRVTTECRAPGEPRGSRQPLRTVFRPREGIC